MRYKTIEMSFKTAVFRNLTPYLLVLDKWALHGDRNFFRKL